MTLVAVGRMLIGDVGVGGGALVEEIARQRPGGQAAAAQRKTLLVLLVAVGAFGTRGGVRPKSKPPRALPPRSRCAQPDMLITGGGGTPTPCTMRFIRPQAEVEDVENANVR